MDEQTYIYRLSNPGKEHSLLCPRGPLYPELRTAWKRNLEQRERLPLLAKEEWAWFVAFAKEWNEERERGEGAALRDGDKAGF